MTDTATIERDEFLAYAAARVVAEALAGDFAGLPDRMRREFDLTDDELTTCWAIAGRLLDREVAAAGARILEVSPARGLA